MTDFTKLPLLELANRASPFDEAIITIGDREEETITIECDGALDLADRLIRYVNAQPANDEMLRKLLDVCRAYHQALDTAFAMLIEVTRGKPADPFMPSKSPMWPAMQGGHDVVASIEAELARRTA